MVVNHLLTGMILQVHLYQQAILAGIPFIIG